MDNQIEPNSFKYKEEKKRLEQVTTGKVTTRKRSGARRFADLFLAEDIGNVKEYIVFDLLIPAIKDMIVNMINNTTELLAYGRVKNGRNQTKASTYISYNNYAGYSRPTQAPRQEPNRVGNSLDDIIFESRAEAELVLDNLRECIDQYGEVTVRDYLDAVGISGDKYTNYTQNNYGWTDLREAYIVRVREGFMIVMPRVIQITR